MAGNFDLMGVAGGGKMAAAGDDTEVVISGGGQSVKTTIGGMKRAARANGVAGDHLRAFIERIERLEDERKTVGDDIKDVYGEAKGMGFSTKTIRKVIAIRKKGQDEWQEEEAILDTYLHALGMIESSGDE